MAQTEIFSQLLDKCLLTLVIVFLSCTTLRLNLTFIFGEMSRQLDRLIAMTCQGTDLQNSQERLGFSVLLRDALTCEQEELESEPQTVTDACTHIIAVTYC